MWTDWGTKIIEFTRQKISSWFEFHFVRIPLNKMCIYLEELAQFYKKKIDRLGMFHVAFKEAGTRFRSIFGGIPYIDHFWGDISYWSVFGDILCWSVWGDIYWFFFFFFFFWGGGGGVYYIDQFWEIYYIHQFWGYIILINFGSYTILVILRGISNIDQFWILQYPPRLLWLVQSWWKLWNKYSGLANET